MPKIKVHKNKNYTVMANYHLRDRRLSLKAKGLMSMMLDFPDNWEYSVRGLVAVCIERDTAVENALRELKKCGYIKIDKLKPNETESGRFEYVYNIYEKPIKQSTEKQEVEKQGVEFLQLEFQGLEKLPLYKDTNKLITNESIIKESIIQSVYLESDIKEQINYDKFDDGRIDEIVVIMSEVLNTTQKKFKIGREFKDAEHVKYVFLKINEFHIEYVFESLDKNTTEIKNIKSYLITCLYNSVFTIENYYDAKMRHDLNS